MTRIIVSTALAAMAAVMAASPAQAQDYTGNVDPSAYSLPTVMHSAIDAQARQRGGRSASRGSPEKTAQICADRPSIRARFGADHPKVRQLESLCARAGY